MEFGEVSEQEFKKTRFSCGNFLQSIEMYQRYKDMGREAYLVAVKDQKTQKILATGLLSARNWRMGKKIFRVAGGWLMDYDGKKAEEILRFLTEEAGKFCRKRGGMVLEITPNLLLRERDLNNKIVQGGEFLARKELFTGVGYRYLGEHVQAKWIFVLNLKGKTEDELLAGLRMTHRRLIRKAERNGVKVRELGPDELEIMKKIVAETGERQGFRDPTLEYYRSMKEHFGKKLKFVVAEMPKENLREADRDEMMGEIVPLAVAMFVDDGKEMIYFYGGSVRKLQRYSGPYMVQWEMIRETLKMGYPRYNFYGVRPVEGDGVYQFKQGFRGNVEELVGAFALPLGLLGRLYLSRVKTQEMRQIQ